MIPLGLTFRRGGQASLLCCFPTLRPAPQNCGSAAADFILEEPQSPACGRQAQRNSPQFFVPSLLCELFFFFFSQRRRGAKKLWSARFDFRRPLRLSYFARYSFFLLAKMPSPARRGGRKEIVSNSLLLFYFASYSFFLFSSREGAETQRNCGPILLWYEFSHLASEVPAFRRPWRLGGFARLIFLFSQ